MKKYFLFLLFIISCQWIFAQTWQVSGVIVDDEDKLPMPGVNVFVQNNRTIGTITDVDGTFSLRVPNGNTIEISFIGYKTQTIVITKDETLSIVLESNVQMLDEVVAIGYGTMKKSDLTGAVSSIKADQLQKAPAAGLDQALQGRAAGVTVNSSSGQPGAAAEIRIRGVGTINGASPIYVVDGVIVSDISFLNPNDVASTEILKDASATAIYGSRGANGVILITTKSGKSGRSNISLNSYFGVQNAWKKLDLMKRDEFAETIIRLNNVQSETNYFQNNGFNKWLTAYRLGSSPYYPTNLDYSQIETDWQDEVFNDNALIQNYHVAIDGSSEKSTYAISASYFNQDGTIIGSNYERITLRLNTTYQVRSWLKVGENLSFSTSTGRNAMNNSSSPGASVLSAALAMAPWDPVRYPEGSVNIDGKDLGGQIAASSNFRNVTNPYSMVEMNEPKSVTDRWVGNVFAEITPVKDLTLRSSVSVDMANRRDKLFKYAYVYSDFDKSDKSYLSSNMYRYNTVIFENILTYNKSFGEHNITAMAGQTTEEYNYYTIGGSGANILNPKETNWYLSQTTEDKTYAGDDVERTRIFSLLGRLHYSYGSRYMATINFRADGSSKFPENLWGYFPSTALAWRITEEEWLKDRITNLDFIKLRAGWGRIGNDQVDQSSFFLTMFNTGPTFVDYVLGTNQQLANGATILTYANTNGKWETTEQTNIGVDFGFFNGVIGGNLDFYIRDTKDMILPVKAPAHVGNRYDAVSNIGTVRNAGIELTLDHNYKIGKLNYNINGNFSYVKNELTALNGGSILYYDDNKTIINEGYALYTLWGYKYEGIYETDDAALRHLHYYTTDDIPFHAGDAKFADLNGDGKIDDSDKTDLGNRFPSLTYALNIGASYENFDLQVFFQGIYGNKLYNAVREKTEGKGLEATLGTQMRDVWTRTNPFGAIPNPYGSSLNSATSSRFVEDGSYLRLKNVQIGYSLPKSLISAASISRCRVYVSASNLLTFTKYTGYDPEVGSSVDYGNYPQSRTILFGLNVDF